MPSSISAPRFHFDLPTLRVLLFMSIPMIISQGAFAVMIFTDRFFLAQISPAHMAAAMGGGVAWFFSYSLFNGILAYANALVAQYLGANEAHKCSKVITQGFIMTAACIPLLLLISVFMSRIFAAMGHAPTQVELEKVYYNILMLSSVTTLLKVCLASFFSGIGRTRVVMVCEVLGILFNIPLSYILVFGKLGIPPMGMAGAAWGTFISSIATVALFLFFYLQQKNCERFSIRSAWVFDKGICKRYIRLGFPSGIEMFLNVAAFNLFLLMFHSYGIAEAAAATIVFNWDILSFVPLLGLNIAVMSMIGRSVGARDMSMVNAVTTSGYALGLGYSLLLTTLFLTFRYELVDLFIFSDDHAQSIRALARFMMLGLSCYVLCEGVLQVAAGVLRGAGDTRWIMFASVSLHWAMLLSQYFIIKVYDYGPRISWISFVLMIIAILVVFLIRLNGSRWRDPARLNAVMTE